MSINPDKQGKTSICVDYALSVLLGNDFVASANRQKIIYANPETISTQEPNLCIVPSGFFGADYGHPNSLPELPLQKIDGIELLYGKPIVRRQGNLLITEADVIASTYFLVTRYEELIRPNVRDDYGRFPGRESLPFRAGFIERPIVEEYACLLRQWLREIGIDVPKPQRRFSALLTHDVDFIRRSGSFTALCRSAAATLLGRQKPEDLCTDVAAYLGLGKDRYDTIDEIIELDKTLVETTDEIEIGNLYFVMANPIDKPRPQLLKAVVNKIQQSGAEIGIHPSLEAGDNPTLIAKEKSHLEELCKININASRHHFLRWLKISAGWALREAGINTDATLGYSDVPGFRLGVCRPIELFDPIELKHFAIAGHPLILMDATLNDEPYNNMTTDELLDMCRGLIEQTRKHSGQFVLLWHNTPSFRGNRNLHLSFYARILKELAHSASKKIGHEKSLMLETAVF